MCHTRSIHSDLGCVVDVRSRRWLTSSRRPGCCRGRHLRRTLTPIVGNTIVGSVSLKGVVDERIKGRTSDTETGIFATDITGLSLSGELMLSGGGPLDGATLMVTLGGSPSTGTTTITADGSVFKIDSFFDVFIDVSIPGTTLSKSVGPILLVAVPEPSTWAMVLIGFAALSFAARRHARAAAPAA